MAECLNQCGGMEVVPVDTPNGMHLQLKRGNLFPVDVDLQAMVGGETFCPGQGDCGTCQATLMSERPNPQGLAELLANYPEDEDGVIVVPACELVSKGSSEDDAVHGFVEFDLHRGLVVATCWAECS